MLCYILHLIKYFTGCYAGNVNQKEFRRGDRFFYFPGDGDGTLHLVDTQEPVDEMFIHMYARNPEYNEYWLFTR